MGEETIDAKKRAFAKRNFKKHRLCLNAIDVTNFCAKAAVTVKVIIDKTCGEVSLMEQDTIEMFLSL